MDNNQVQIIAAAPGTIIAKADGSNDALLDALRAFEKTGEAMKAFSTASKAKFEDITATLADQAKQIGELRSHPPQPPSH